MEEERGKIRNRRGKIKKWRKDKVMEYWKEEDKGRIRKAKLCVANFAKRTHGQV
jgi:hypothetical protein